ncbi:small acid-soluble spore protein SspI [Rummeliibacillus pycnus]|uniref:small acid-soluble spore protein SspI n=1 Tax=Rummeliibacillus pycnus TaxID=101070 RepID=UPI000C9D23B8|nr:small acid-soluble spore protein SspI [Rummeliibacillus pycnus]
MNFQIRDAIKKNVSGNSPDQLKDIVEDAITRGEEHLLPGLGVFFEAWWQQADQKEQDHFMSELSKALA